MNKEFIRNKILRHRRILSSGCWVYGGQKHKRYGSVSVDGVRYSVHRASFLVFVGDIPDGLFVCHSCDHKPCCNPAHLFIGTQSDNGRDRQDKGRSGVLEKVKRPISRRPLVGGNSFNGTQRGESNGNARLTKENVCEILTLRSQGSLLSEIAELYSVDRSTIGKIVRGTRWSRDD